MQQSFNDVKRRESPKKKEDTGCTQQQFHYLFFLFIFLVYLFLTLLPGVGSSWIDKIPIRGVCVCVFGADAASRAIS